MHPIWTICRFLIQSETIRIRNPQDRLRLWRASFNDDAFILFISNSSSFYISTSLYVVVTRMGCDRRKPLPSANHIHLFIHISELVSVEHFEHSVESLTYSMQSMMRLARRDPDLYGRLLSRRTEIQETSASTTACSRSYVAPDAIYPCFHLLDREFLYIKAGSIYV
ncbi:hypothetical protein BJ138DRAFT_619902 [Hygrophoropsis aurantiaca]|uniref:Uncharacterized protein n=1 Tax=Hygrophoropsis aurantiaca TaxID=72124 RepID=A0ACB8A089_9AGAM|nr:hypothetical protein BJ138DRAFT_619902 [Hygrophoropsis aurantiaca]